MPLGEDAIERAANEVAVGNDEENEENHRRHGAEHKFTELIQYLVHGLWVGGWIGRGRLESPVLRLFHAANLCCTSAREDDAWSARYI
jgi:hypothetical protein